MHEADEPDSLVYLASYPLPVAAATGAFAVSELVGSYAYWKAGSIRWRTPLPLCLGALPCAFGGALLVDSVPAASLELAIGLLTLGSGIHALVGRRTARARADARRARI